MYKLQRLRIPAGWEVILNKFLDIEVMEYSADDEIWYDMTQDIMYLKRQSK